MIFNAIDYLFTDVIFVYRTVNMYSDLKLRMGPSELSFQSSRVPKVCGRASEVWSGARSARPTLGIRAHRVAFGRSARSKKKFLQKQKSKRRQVFRWYERACVCHKRTQAVGLCLGGRAFMQSERASLQPPEDERE